VKQANIRLYVDADVLGLAKILVQLRSDVTYPGDNGGVLHKRQRPPCPITSPHIADNEWIPETSRQGWLIVTRDTAIQHNRAEIAAVRDSGARMVALAGAQAGTTWAQLEIVLCQWRRIEALLAGPGPFIYTATRSSLRRVPLN
jgi:PIN like domain